MKYIADTSLTGMKLRAIVICQEDNMWNVIKVTFMILIAPRWIRKLMDQAWNDHQEELRRPLEFPIFKSIRNNAKFCKSLVGKTNIDPEFTAWKSFSACAKELGIAHLTSPRFRNISKFVITNGIIKIGTAAYTAKDWNRLAAVEKLVKPATELYETQLSHWLDSYPAVNPNRSTS